MTLKETLKECNRVYLENLYKQWEDRWGFEAWKTRLRSAANVGQQEYHVLFMPNVDEFNGISEEEQLERMSEVLEMLRNEELEVEMEQRFVGGFYITVTW